MISKGDSKQMATKQAKYGKAYNTPIGLQEDSYYEMMYELMDYVKKKGLTTRQAQQLFTDCFDMVLDVKPNISSDNDEISDTDKIVNELDKLSRTISGICLLRS